MAPATQRSTAFSDAFASAGLQTRDYALAAALDIFRNRGGDAQRARELVEFAFKEMLAEDLKNCASREAIQILSSGQHPLEDGGDQRRYADTAKPDVSLPSSSEREGGISHSKIAEIGQKKDAAPVARDPSVGQRSAVLAVARAAASTILDTLIIDGKPLGDWTVAEARLTGRAKSREGYILIEASRLVANAPPGKRLRDVVKVAEIQRIEAAAKDFADGI